MGGRPWPLPFIMKTKVLEAKLRELALENNDALIAIILALADYHAECYTARETLAGKINEILPDDPSVVWQETQ